MTVYEELQARGLIAQVTSEEEVSKLVNAGKATVRGFELEVLAMPVDNLQLMCRTHNRHVAEIDFGRSDRALVTRSS